MPKTDVRSERKKLQEAEHKKEIIRAAESFIVRRGFGRLTMDGLAREAQFSKATLYRYFRSKTEVVAAIFINYFDRMKERLSRIHEGRAGYSARLKDIIRAILEMHEETRNLSRALLLDEAFLKKAGFLFASPGRPLPASEDRRAMSLIHEKIREVSAELSGFLAEGVRAGEFRATDPAMTVLWLTAALDGFSLRQPWLPAKVGIREATDFIHQFIMNGLARRGGSRKGETR